MPIQKQLERIFVRLNASLYRVSGGKLGGRVGQAPILLLNTVGRKSGQRRTSPLLYRQVGDRYLIAGSHRGAPTHPAWVLNLRANPEAEVEIGKQTIPVVATELSAAERETAWPQLDAIYSSYADYRTKTDRTIPLFALTPRANGAAAPPSKG
ncbi:nitroreductase family deazaflavin-dependent oxidoreductase [Nocardia iowensis]|uniref:Nitroreductase family deazaflavin-dependent oxidoreductase n=1 Tax=Nocardia iowensis TaxID=204891 RepID=A0ABX8RWE0_NOCIO|nr:nitroreductase family deazaflavin-dependent oxidoreductase [Nocardia iowensis]QXN93970.1 nitroreductase family deazaflavin-dependent oxidoreductase [Nocardia iowensis]